MFPHFRNLMEWAGDKEISEGASSWYVEALQLIKLLAKNPSSACQAIVSTIPQALLTSNSIAKLIHKTALPGFCQGKCIKRSVRFSFDFSYGFSRTNIYLFFLLTWVWHWIALEYGIQNTKYGIQNTEVVVFHFCFFFFVFGLHLLKHY